MSFKRITGLFLFLFIGLFSIHLFGIIEENFLASSENFQAENGHSFLPIDNLKNALNTLIKDQKGRVGLFFQELASPRSTISIDDAALFNPASVIKIPVMAVVYAEVEGGNLRLTDTLKITKTNRVGGAGILQFQRPGSVYSVEELIERMIIDSDNTATKMLIEKITPGIINGYMKEWGLTDTFIAESNLLKANGRNFTTPRDMGILLAHIYERKRIPKWASYQMIELLGKQRFRKGIPRYLPKEIHISNKTGTLNGVKHDCGIVFFQESPYVLSIFTSEFSSARKGEELVALLSKEIYEWEKQKNQVEEAPLF